ncbi:MAG: type III secretion system chaperone [Pseudomonadota bacterium]
MTPADNARKVLHEFSEASGIEDLTVDEDNRAFLLFQNEYGLFIEVSEEKALLMLSSSLGTPNVPDEAALFRLLLTVNGLWRDNAITFGIEPQSGYVMQMCALPAADLTLERFQQALANHIEALATFQAIVDGDGQAGQAVAAEAQGGEEADVDPADMTSAIRV